MKGRYKTIRRYLKNDRINDYEKILSAAVDNGYKIISMEDYIGVKNSTDKLLILRHDIDYTSKANLMMFEIEKKYNARASYYFRKQTVDAELIFLIKEYGGEASLHFETIADYIREHNITNREQLFKTDFKNQCLDILKQDLIQLRKRFQIKCSTIASHGATENRLVGIHNNYLTEDVNIYGFLDIKLEAYQKEFISHIGEYISDTVIEENGGFRYGKHPISVIENGVSPLLFLTHPSHWLYNNRQIFKKIIKVMVYGNSFFNDKFTRI